MSKAANAPLPLWRLAAYVVILGVCGVLASRELYYAIAAERSTATVVMMGQAGRGRAVRYWADYEYFDARQVRHVGRADSVHPATNPGDEIAVQYLRSTPEVSRVAPSPVMGLSFGAVALLAAVVLGAEVVTWWRRRRRRE